MNKAQAIFLRGVLVTGFLLPAAAGAIGFENPYYNPGNADNDYLNWTADESRAGNTQVTTGGIVTSNAPSDITIVGQNDSLDPDGLCMGPCSGNTWFYIPAQDKGTVFFDWEFDSNDSDLFWDPPGYILDKDLSGTLESTDFVLFQTNGSPPQSGFMSFEVEQNQLFGWFQSTVNSLNGAGSLTISNLGAPGPSIPPDPIPPIPLPAPLALLGFGLLIPAMRRWR